MKIFISIMVTAAVISFSACESSDDISLNQDHTVPDCKTLTLTANNQTKIIDDAIVTKELWGFVPTVNLQEVVLPTVSATSGTSITMSVVISDNVGIKTAELAYSTWLVSKYINFSNPEGDIPLKPKSYTFTATIGVPASAIKTPWIETFTFNDGSTLKISQSYHKLTLTVIDVNMNKRIVPVFVKVQ